MEDLKPDTDGGRALQPYLTLLGAWALAIGCAVGQGAFLMPGKLFLHLGGPVGLAIGMAVGGLLMLLIGATYHFMINRYPDAGGTFTYAKKTLGYDHGFLCAWFLLIAYVAVLWANATAVPILLRQIFGGAFQFGCLYEISGQPVFFGEVVLALAVMAGACVLCLKKSFAASLQIICGLGLCLAVALAFVLIFEGREEGLACVAPAFPPPPAGADPSAHTPTWLGILNLVLLAPWAFVGFESISNSAAEFRFHRRKTWWVMASAVALGVAVYVMLTLIAASAVPEGCAGWPDYVNNIRNGAFHGYDGTAAAIPTFFGMYSALGALGKALFVVAALCAVLTGIIGNFIAASRLLYALAADRLIPRWFGQLGRDHAPNHALYAILAISLFIPFLGRTALGWIVDVTTIGALIVYAYTSASAWLTARHERNWRMAVLGWVGMTISLLFMVFFLYPDLLKFEALGIESYLILCAWCILGFFVFRNRLLAEHEGRLGRSIVVWMVLLALIVFSSVVWMYKETKLEIGNNVTSIIEGYKDELAKHNLVRAHGIIEQGEGHIKDLLDGLRQNTILNILLETFIISIAMGVIFSIFHHMHAREKKLELDKQMAEEVSRAKTTFLSNMSHEIRTPMNAIIGLDNIALRDPDLPPKARAHLEKIGSSAHHLLGLINDILDMSRIESGRMALKNEEFPFRDFLEQINVIINGQCVDKGLMYSHRVEGAVDDYYVGDDMKLKQVLINVLGNAVKFTPSPGSVTFTVAESSRFEGYRTLTFTVADTGIGMDKGFLPKLFEAFSQENATATSHYGGSGLGMSITRSLVQMMDGDIKVESQKGQGTTFTITVTLKASSRSAAEGDPASALAHLRVLIVDNDPVAVDHAKLELAALGINSDSCATGEEATLLVRDRRAQGKPYHFLLTDLKMPEMDGVELTRAIRQFDNGETAVIIMTGYDFDVQSEAAQKAGVDGFVYKPLFSNSLRREFLSVMRKRQIDFANGAEPASPEESALSGRTMLIAEDMDLNAEILADLLEIEGVKSDRAENGAEAVKMFVASAVNQYDAVLMDMRMPEMDGLAATRAIRALDRPDAKTVPIVAMTANAFEDDVQRSLQAGLNAHLAKPVEPERLYEVLRLLIARRENGD